MRRSWHDLPVRACRLFTRAHTRSLVIGMHPDQPASLFPGDCVYFTRAGTQPDEGHGAVVAIFTRLRHSHELPAAVDASDAILVSRALREREAFAALYLRYLDEMSRFCFLRLHDEDAARDATQQIFAQALAGLAHHRETAPVRAR